MRTFWDEKMSQETLKNILDNKPLFDGTGRLADVITNQSNLVGFEIVPIRAKGVTVKIEKIGLQFKGTGDVKVYLFHSSRQAALKEMTFTRTRNNGMEWFTPTDDLYLPYVNSDKDAGGSWYMVYSQDDLPSNNQAITTSKDWSKKPCDCNRGELADWKIWRKFLEVHPFKVSEYDTPIALWDIEDNIYTYETNYGINLQITIECDITEIALEQKKAFQNIIGLQVAIDMLREFAYNPAFNINRISQNPSMQQILYELDGDSQGYKKSGLVHAFNNAMKAVKLDSTDMSRVCFPCNNKGVRYRTV